MHRERTRILAGAAIAAIVMWSGIGHAEQIDELTAQRIRFYDEAKGPIVARVARDELTGTLPWEISAKVSGFYQVRIPSGQYAGRAVWLNPFDVRVSAGEISSSAPTVRPPATTVPGTIRGISGSSDESRR